MAVMFYGVGEHPAGFVGFRVATTVGNNDNYRQKYFSLNKYGYSQAYILAHKADAEWRREAEEEVADSLINTRRKNAGKSIISQGLIAEILVENKVRGGNKKTYFYPAFSVKTPGRGKGYFNFRVEKHGYENAYRMAVHRYCETHGINNSQHDELIARMPDRSLFTGYLLDKTHSRGHSITKDEIEIKLNKP